MTVLLTIILLPILIPLLLGVTCGGIMLIATIGSAVDHFFFSHFGVHFFG
jgi:hypothetical protein